MVATLDDSPARAHFAALIARAPVPLAETALAIAQEEYPHLDVAHHLRLLDGLAHQVRGRVGELRGPAALLRALRAVLFDEAGFRGNDQDYYDPRNSFLNDVLERRLGIPITLAIVTIEVAARAGLVLHGVGFPGHFLVKHVLGERETFLDPFNKGEILSADDCLDRLRRFAPGRAIERHHLDAVTERQTIARMLHNLKRIYIDRGDDMRAMWVVDRLVLLAPEDAHERRDRGLVAARLGGIRAAVVDLEAYLAAAPSAPDAPAVRKLAEELREQSPRLN